MNLTYNQEDEVTQITGLAATDTFQYDGDGRRVSRTVGSLTTYYSHDGSDVILEVTGTSQVYRIPGVGECSGSYGQSYQLDDQLGSNVGEVGSSTSFNGQYNYDGYGLETDTATGRPSGTSVFRFAGKHGYLTDNDTGFVLCGARYYIPMVGRFMTQDPTGHGGGMNLYEYCGDSPTRAVDPSGAVEIELISYRVFGAGWHRGIVVIDNVGHGGAYSFAGGPESYGIGHSGSLVSRSGIWASGSQDWDQWHYGGRNDDGSSRPRPDDERRAAMLVSDGSSYADWVSRFQGIEREIASHKPQDYAPLPSDFHLWGGKTANSNTWTRYLLGQAGLLGAFERANAKSSLPFAPGWNVQLPYNDAPGK